MRTKIAYVTVADEESIYLEQAYVSIWSLKTFNPSADVILIMDNKSYDYYESSGYLELKKLVNKVIVHNFEDSCTNHYRSRWLKTNLCELLCDDFLFLDTDTIVLGDLSDIDNFQGNIGAVEDLHQPSLSTCRYLNFIKRKTKQIGWPEFDLAKPYYNSGVLLVRNTDVSKSFFRKWHENWIYGNSRGCPVDQLSLNYTNRAKDTIMHVDDKYHCQILGNGLNYLRNALIIHYFNTSKQASKGVKPFFLMEDKYLLTIKKTKTIPSDIKDIILSQRGLFPLQIDILSGISSRIYYSNFFNFLIDLIIKRPTLFSFLNKSLARLHII